MHETLEGVDTLLLPLHVAIEVALEHKRPVLKDVIVEC